MYNYIILLLPPHAYLAFQLWWREWSVRSFLLYFGLLCLKICLLKLWQEPIPGLILKRWVLHELTFDHHGLYMSRDSHVTRKESYFNVIDWMNVFHCVLNYST